MGTSLDFTTDPEDSGKTRERRHISAREITSTFLLLMNFGGLVWGAATMSSSVKQLEASIIKLNTFADGLTLQMAQVREDYGARIRLLEFQVSELRVTLEKTK